MRKQKSRRSGRQLLSPPQHVIDALRRKLPVFEPYDQAELFADARALDVDDLGLNAAVLRALRAKEKQQIEQLLTCLRLDPNKPDWQSAFLTLAKLDFNVGRLVHHETRPTNSNAKTWSKTDEQVFLNEVQRLIDEGKTESEALETIGNDPTFDTIFPYRKQTQVRGETKGRAAHSRARKEALRKRYAALIATPAADSLHGARAAIDFFLGHELPEPPVPGLEDARKAP